MMVQLEIIPDIETTMRDKKKTRSSKLLTIGATADT